MKIQKVPTIETNLSEHDDVVGSLRTIITDSRTDPQYIGSIKEGLLMTKLVSFVTRRDHDVWNHAYKLGKKHAIEQKK